MDDRVRNKLIDLASAARFHQQALDQNDPSLVDLSNIDHVQDEYHVIIERLLETIEEELVGQPKEGNHNGS